MRPWLASIIALASCGGEGEANVRVDLRTDYVAGVELDRAVAIWDTDEYPRAFAPAERDRLDHRLAELTAPYGSYPLEVRLERPDGSTLATRAVNVSVQSASVGVTVVISRACGGATCEVDESCLGGRCVPPGCVRGDEAICPPPLCAAAADCTELTAPCVMPTCEFGVCAYRGECGSDEYCDPALGCVALTPTDAGADAGFDAGADAGPPFDAGFDAGPPPCVPFVDPDCPDCRDPARWPWAEDEAAFLERLNEIRAGDGMCDERLFSALPALRMDRDLQEAARCHALYMSEIDDVDIRNASGNTPGEEAETDGYPGSTRSHGSSANGTAPTVADRYAGGTFCELPTNAGTHPAIGVGFVIRAETSTERFRVYVHGTR